MDNRNLPVNKIKPMATAEAMASSTRQSTSVRQAWLKEFSTSYARISMLNAALDAAITTVPRLLIAVWITMLATAKTALWIPAGSPI